VKSSRKLWRSAFLVRRYHNDRGFVMPNPKLSNVAAGFQQIRAQTGVQIKTFDLEQLSKWAKENPTKLQEKLDIDVPWWQTNGPPERPSRIRQSP